MYTGNEFTPRRTRLVCLFFALLLSLSAQAQTRQPAARVEAVRFESKLVRKTLPYNVVLPPLYVAPEPRAVRCPVLYLLHGLRGGACDWL